MSRNSSDNQTPQSLGGTASEKPLDGARQRHDFVSLALTMGWQLAAAVLVPLIGGALLDRALNTTPVLTFIGMAVAVLASIVVMWRTMQTANSLPVPKLTESQRQAIKKQYDEDDD